MSKAFTKDDDGGDGPLLVAPRVPLPSGSPNYVTERGLALLRAELGQELERWAARTPPTSDTERARAGARHAARVAELEARIGCAVLVDSARQPRDEVRFGARVRVRNSAGSQRTYRIVGVDEANAASGDVAFVAPLARSLLGKRVGDVELVRTPAGEDELEVLAIEYD
jgi:transcription elongation factor GreB